MPANAFVVGHVGRFMEQKNHAHLVRVATELAKDDPLFHLMLVGDGPLRPAIEAEVARTGLKDRVHFLGVRTDVAAILQTFDVFAMPSLHEGLPLVGLEAQAAGVPLVMTDTITTEADVIPELVRRVSPKASARAWAAAVVEMRAARDTITADRAMSRLRDSPFNIEYGVRELERLYEDSVILGQDEPQSMPPRTLREHARPLRRE